MKYMLLVYHDEQTFAELGEAERASMLGRVHPARSRDEVERSVSGGGAAADVHGDQGLLATFGCGLLHYRAVSLSGSARGERNCRFRGI